MSDTPRNFCTSCGTALEPTHTFCPSCGAATGEGAAADSSSTEAVGPNACPNCGAINDDSVLFCTQCGTHLREEGAAATAPIAAAAPPPSTAPATAPIPTTSALPDGQFKAEGKWWYRQGDKLQVFEGGQWVLATREPAMDSPSAAPAGSAVGSAVRVGPLIGAAAIGVSALLGWIAFAGESSNGFDVPVAVLWDKTAESGLDLGWVLIALAVAAAALCFRADASLPRRTCGGVAVLVAAVYVFQLDSALSELGGGGPNVFDVTGLGVFVALGGGLVLAIDR
ncbi:MAG: zinc ribbon domain-containing protein [Actinobacteria bacterium]|nr:zinc ribbon domain-containing protein [Actinomycetota bacterium]